MPEEQKQREELAAIFQGAGDRWWATANQSKEDGITASEFRENAESMYELARLIRGF